LRPDGFRKSTLRGPVRHRLGHHPADQLAFWLLRQSQDFGGGSADIRVADRESIDVARLEIRTDRSGEIECRRG
jgi:hypothetical protein